MGQQDEGAGPEPHSTQCIGFFEANTSKEVIEYEEENVQHPVSR